VVSICDDKLSIEMVQRDWVRVTEIESLSVTRAVRRSKRPSRTTKLHSRVSISMKAPQGHPIGVTLKTRAYRSTPPNHQACPKAQLSSPPIRPNRTTHSPNCTISSTWQADALLAVGCDLWAIGDFEEIRAHECDVVRSLRPTTARTGVWLCCAIIFCSTIQQGTNPERNNSYLSEF
jgi:hypothetical protein